ncbi:glycoside hydrolase family 16 protein [Kineococcus aurantiacus]|uniref:Beta-glucanase (GH16 family) n=1 Tax=Kineococcus aurantiacus TaxID=37633 RepID=A0A7Y9DJF8_9ACTN|nr:glycoside hydrolase family 16 protein [Kineococcus aurantiacus]NYD20728.1 beta-glucanase (GH16 family) [Kineococcus aurantiacus]
MSTTAPPRCPAPRSRWPLGLAGAAVAAALAVSTAAPAEAAVTRPPASGGGWTRTFVDDFNSLDSTKWSRYEGTSSAGGTRWTREQATVTNGKLVLQTEKTSSGWRTGGVSSARAGSQSYGKWLIRFRADAGDGLGYVFLLYPQGGGWPPEVDIAENGGGDKQETLGALHYDDAYGNHQRIHKRLTGVDFTTWRTVGVELSRGKISWTLDGQPWATSYTSGVPDEKMWLGLQGAVHDDCTSGRTCVNSTTPRSADIEIDWVARYKRS